MILTYDLWDELQTAWCVITLYYLTTEILSNHIELAIIHDPSDRIRGELMYHQYPVTVTVNVAQHDSREELIQTLIHECKHIDQRLTHTEDEWEQREGDFDAEAEFIALRDYRMFV